MSKQITWFDNDADQLADMVIFELDKVDLAEISRTDQKAIIIRAINKYIGE